MARPRTPTEEHILRGTFREDRHGTNQPATEKLDHVPPAPSSLGRKGKSIWHDSAECMLEMRILTREILHSLEAYCRLWDELISVGVSIGKLKSIYYETASGSIQTHPAAKRRGVIYQDMLRFQIQFGFTPASRSSIGAKQTATTKVQSRNRKQA